MMITTYNALMTTLYNARTFHHRVLARFLRTRGWVVFYLEPQARTCKTDCWLKLYLESEKREEVRRDG
jgi:hypothetical protein